MPDSSVRSNYSNSLFKTHNQSLWNNKFRWHHKQYRFHGTALNTLLIKCDWIYGNIFKSFTNSSGNLQIPCSPHSCCFLFHLSFTTRRRCYICLMKVLEDSLYLMFYALCSLPLQRRLASEFICAPIMCTIIIINILYNITLL